MKRFFLFLNIFILLFAGCSNQYVMTFTGIEHSNKFIQDFSVLMNTHQLEALSNSTEEYWQSFLASHPEIIDEWSIYFPPDGLFDSYERIQVWLRKYNGDYRITIVPGSVTPDTLSAKYMGIIKSWLTANYPDIEAEITIEQFLDLR